MRLLHPTLALIMQNNTPHDLEVKIRQHADDGHVTATLHLRETGQLIGFLASVNTSILDLNPALFEAFKELTKGLTLALVSSLGLSTPQIVESIPTEKDN